MRILTAGLMVVAMVAFIACGGGNGSEKAEPVEEQTAAETEAVVEEVAEEAAPTLEELEANLAAMEEKVKGMTPEDLLTEEGKALKEKIEKLKMKIDEMKAAATE